MNNDIENLKKRLIYRSQYRGTKEMDKLVGSFVNTYINSFDSKKLNELEKFLTIDDDNLYKFYNNQIDNIEGANEELLRLFKIFVYKKGWRRDWDSNPGKSCPFAGFQDRCFQPLSHLSVSKVL